MKDLKIKPLTKEQILISIDRLTRFKNPESKYLRVFSEILTHNLIFPSYTKEALMGMEYSQLSNLASAVINYSLQSLGIDKYNDFEINKKILEYEKSIFKISSNVENLLDNKINYLSCAEIIDSNAAKNLQWLKNLTMDKDIIEIRETKGLKYPIEVLLLVEGATEEILLPKFAALMNYDFDKKGIFLHSSGGKNQVVKSYYEYSQTLKIPIYVLLDSDGVESSNLIKPRLRQTDKIHVLNCGEFEDLLPEDLILRTLQYDLQNISSLELNKEISENSRVKTLEQIYKTRGMHEFKKVEFANSVAKNIKSNFDITAEIEQIIKEISGLTKNKICG